MNAIQNVLTISLLAVATSLWAEEAKPTMPEPTGPLDLAQAIALGLANNPLLSAYSYDVRAAEAQRIRAGYRPNPEIGLEVENLPGSGSRSGADATETTLRLSQVIELGGKRSRRLDEARLAGGVAAWDYESRRLDVLADTTQRFIAVAAAQERLTLAREAAVLAETERAVVTGRVQAARNSVVEQKKAEIAVAQAKLEEGHAAHALLAARKTLAVMWGNEDPAFTSARADFFAHRTPETYGSLMAKIGRNPDLARLALEASLRESQLRLARAVGVPDLTLSAGLRQFADENEWAGVFGVSLPLPFFDRGQAGLYEALQMKGKTETLGRAIRGQIAVKLFGIYQELLHAVTELDTMAGDILPAAREVLRTTEEGYQQGRFSYLELADARRSLIELRRANLEAAFNYHTYLAEIDRLIGTAALAPQTPEPAVEKKP
jgi:outer membrane protein, heavy metal efflux system